MVQLNGAELFSACLESQELPTCQCPVVVLPLGLLAENQSSALELEAVVERKHWGWVQS